MSAVDWNKHLSGLGAKVVFSTLCIPDHRDPIERNVACVELADGEMVDIEWNHKNQTYIVRRFADAYQTEVTRIEQSDPASVVQLVQNWARSASAAGAPSGYVISRAAAWTVYWKTVSAAPMQYGIGSLHAIG